MTLVADHCIPDPIICALKMVRYDIVRAKEIGQVTPDAAVMQASLERNYVLLTMDTGIPSQAYLGQFAEDGLTVVLLRWKQSSAREWQEIVETILKEGHKWEEIASTEPSVISVSYGRTRVRAWKDMPSLPET